VKVELFIFNINQTCRYNKPSKTMAKTKVTSQEYFKAISIIYYAMLAGQALIAIMAIYFVSNDFLEADNGLLNDVMLFAVSIYFVIGMAGSYLFFKKRLSRTREIKNFPEKTAHYRAGLILKFAMIEGIALLAIVGFMVTSGTLMLIYFVVAFAFFILIKPSKDKMASELKLTPAQVSLIREPGSVISEIESSY